jgi:GT2 family glycosyltransferase
MIISVLITCHNRKNKTLKCLENLYNQKGINITFVIHVFLVNDGSVDGTREDVTQRFPLVKIIDGDGNLFWNRGMLLAWQTALLEVKSDYYLWLNDDTYLFQDAVISVLSDIRPNSIICGVTCSENSNKITTYGGFKNYGNCPLSPNGFLQECDFCNGNFVLIDANVVNLIGLLDPKFQHALGDFDYSMRAKKSNISLTVSRQFVGTCETHEDVPIWSNPAFTIVKRIKNLYSPLSGCNPIEFFYFDKLHNGIINGIKHFLSIHLRCFLPNIYDRFKS